MNRENTIFLYLRDIFFWELLDYAKDNKNKSLYRFLIKKNKKDGSVALSNQMLILEIFNNEIKINKSKKDDSNNKVAKTDSQDKLVNSLLESVNLSNVYLKEILNFYSQFSADFYQDIKEKFNLQLLINNLSKLTKKEFCQAINDFWSQNLKLNEVESGTFDSTKLAQYYNNHFLPKKAKNNLLQQKKNESYKKNFISKKILVQILSNEKSMIPDNRSYLLNVK